MTATSSNQELIMALERRIESLKRRHVELDLQIMAEESRPCPDDILLHQLKRDKLSVKDTISRLIDEEHRQAA